MGSALVTGGEAVAEALAARNVRHVFGVASVHNLPIVDAIHQRGDICLVEVRHEQAAVHAADGYARASGQLGVALVSTGPGCANAMGGLFEAAYASSPVLVLTGQVDTLALGKGRSVLHEADAQARMLASLCRRVETVRQRAEISQLIELAAADAMCGRPRPVAVELPIDLQSALGEAITPPTFDIRAPATQPELVARVAARLEAAQRPLIWVGGGVVASGADAHLVQLAERLQAPVLTTIEGRGAISEDHPLCLGPTTDFRVMQGVIEEADVIFAVGTRFQTAAAINRNQTLPGAVIHLDIDPHVIGLVHRTEIPWVGDVRSGLVALLDVLRPGHTEPAFLERARAASARAEQEARETIGPDHERIMDVLRAALPPDAVIVKDVTVAALTWANRWLPVYEPRTSMRPTSVGIGSGLPLAIGAAVASERTTLLVQGDGGLMLSVGELATLAQQRLPVVVCVFNDQGYGVLRWAQDTFFDGRRAAVDLATPDFVRLAQAFGIDAVGVGDVEAFEEAIARAVEAHRPWVIDVDLAALEPMRIVPQV